MAASMASAQDQTNANVSLDLQEKPVVKVCAHGDITPERRLFDILSAYLVLWIVSSSKIVQQDVFLLTKKNLEFKVLISPGLSLLQHTKV